MAQNDDARKIVAHLWGLTSANTLSWTPSKAFDAFWADHEGLHFVVDKTDGLPWLSIDGVLVWRDAELGAFFEMIYERFSPRRPTPKPHEPDSRIPQTLKRAIKTLKKK